MPMTKMRVRELRGEINRAKHVYVWVPILGTEGDDEDDEFFDLEVSKPRAKEICDYADDNGIQEICATVEGRKVWIGDVEMTDEGEEETPEGEEEEETEEAAEE